MLKLLLVVSAGCLSVLCPLGKPGSAAGQTLVNFRGANGSSTFNNLADALRSTPTGGTITCLPSSTASPVVINQRVTLTARGSVTVSACGGAFTSKSQGVSTIGIGLPQPVKQYNFSTGQWEPFFSFGYYLDDAVCRPGNSISWDLIQASGGNTVVFDVTPNDSDACIRSLLSGASTRGLKIILGIGHSLLANVVFANPATYQPLESFVMSYRSDPALLGWMLGDENESPQYGLSPTSVSACADLMHMWDPYHQIWQVFGGIDSDFTDSGQPIRPYVGGTDVVITDQYSEWDGCSLFGGTDRTLFYEQNGRDFVGRGHAYGVVGQGLGPTFSGAFPGYKWPDRLEFRWNVISAIAGAGARTYQAWIIPGRLSDWYSNPQDLYDFVSNSVAPVYAELGTIKRAMETGYAVGEISVKCSDTNQIPPPALLLYDSSPPQYHLAVANVMHNPVSVTITISNLPAVGLGLYADRYGQKIQLNSAGGGAYTFKDSLADHDAVIYHVPLQ